MSKSILSITASAQQEHSLSRQLGEALITRLQEQEQIDDLIERDLSRNDVALITQEHIAAFYTPESDLNDQQARLLEQSDTLVEEVLDADILVISTPMYNFSVPASLKAWIDMICRVGKTFRYTEQGPEGLSAIETAYLVVTTGGAPVNSAVDFVVPYLKQVAAFIGVKDVKVIAADATNADRDAAIAKANADIQAL